MARISAIVLADTETHGELGRVLNALALVHIAGACAFCVNAFDVNEGVRQANVPLLGEYHGHPSLRQRVADGYEVVTF